MAFAVNHLTGRAHLWGTVEWEKTPACSSFDTFSQGFKRVFGLARAEPCASCLLMGRRQGNWSVATYSIDFCTRACESSLNLSSLCEAFLFSLADYIKDELVFHELPTTSDGLVDLATWIDLRIQTLRRERGLGPPRCSYSDRPSRPSVAPSDDCPTRASRYEPDSMQVGCNTSLYATAANLGRFPSPLVSCGPESWCLHPGHSSLGGVSQVGTEVYRALQNPDHHQDHPSINTMKIKPTFHVFRLKQVHESPLVTAAPPLHFLDGGEVNTVKRLLRSRQRGKGLQDLVD